jgi:hypothetical protein
VLDLDSPRWSELDHAYGPATDIPDLLRSALATIAGVKGLPDVAEAVSELSPELPPSSSDDSSTEPLRDPHHSTGLD